MLKNTLTPTVDAAKQSSINTQLEIAFANCDRLGKAVAALRNRLEPVSSKPPPSCQSEAKEQVWLPPLADKLRELGHNLLCIEDSVQTATNLLEI